MNVLITGATGLVGNKLVALLHKDNHVIHYLSTSKSKLKNNLNYKGFYWNPSTGEIDTKGRIQDLNATRSVNIVLIKNSIFISFCLISE